MVELKLIIDTREINKETNKSHKKRIVKQSQANLQIQKISAKKAKTHQHQVKQLISNKRYKERRNNKCT
jgi:hypothetical protein